jgi:hypothetical protein
MRRPKSDFTSNNINTEQSFEECSTHGGQVYPQGKVYMASAIDSQMTAVARLTHEGTNIWSYAHGEHDMRDMYWIWIRVQIMAFRQAAYTPFPSFRFSPVLTLYFISINSSVTFNFSSVL